MAFASFGSDCRGAIYLLSQPKPVNLMLVNIVLLLYGSCCFKEIPVGAGHNIRRGDLSEINRDTAVREKDRETRRSVKPAG